VGAVPGETRVPSNSRSTIGDMRAPDCEILLYAVEHGYVVFTHDLDFGALLALGKLRQPSIASGCCRFEWGLCVLAFRHLYKGARGRFPASLTPPGMSALK
jgi:hypothetical protein